MAKPVILIILFTLNIFLLKKLNKAIIEQSTTTTNKVIKLGFFPIGQKKIPKINCRVGNVVTVIYDEKQPEKAYVDGNNGMINC